MKNWALIISVVALVIVVALVKILMDKNEYDNILWVYFSLIKWNFGITFEDHYLGNEFKVSHLFIFECKFFMHITKEHKNQLEPKSCKGIFVGYDNVTKRLFLFYTSKI